MNVFLLQPGVLTYRVYRILYRKTSAPPPTVVRTTTAAVLEIIIVHIHLHTIKITTVLNGVFDIKHVIHDYMQLVFTYRQNGSSV